MTHEEAKAYREKLNADKEMFADFHRIVIDMFQERQKKLINECPHVEVSDDICKLCKKDFLEPENNT